MSSATITRSLIVCCWSVIVGSSGCLEITIKTCNGQLLKALLSRYYGPEYISQSLVDWANEHHITLMYIQPGKPTQNAYIERFNRTVRHEWLDMHLFESIEHAQYLATEWLWTYNNERPNSAIGGVPPRQLLLAA